jgi:hypothetical protein
MVLLAFAAGGSSSERKRSRPIRAFSATPHDGQRRCRTLLKIPAESSPELLIPGAAAQTRVVSLAGIRLGSWESARARLVSPAQASLPRSWPTPELRIPNAAAQTRIVSKARIRLDSGKAGNLRILPDRIFGNDTVYCFVFLYLAFVGGGPISVDAMLERKR